MKDNDDPKQGPITAGVGAHPVGTGVGAASGVVAGAVIGTVLGGPVGGIVGGAVGGVTGAVAGQSAAAILNPADEDAFWSANYLERAYVEPNRPYADYRPAYQYGWESRARMGQRAFREVESDLERGWDVVKGESQLAWEQAKHATSDAWHRIKGDESAEPRRCH